ncbi:hypothetical protein GE061_005826 [Apolygus lucorum]|uniref:Uncharacterized protein n=1 Tax=Apolygus lucorum TaxID=248454 RepID=A0A8S9WZ39_APOLU|nr:hypothetical protein GE061_005826 [Apolygus lucorum]
MKVTVVIIAIMICFCGIADAGRRRVFKGNRALKGSLLESPKYSANSVSFLENDTFEIKGVFIVMFSFTSSTSSLV